MLCISASLRGLQMEPTVKHQQVRRDQVRGSSAQVSAKPLRERAKQAHEEQAAARTLNHFTSATNAIG